MTDLPRHSVSVAAVVTDEAGRILVIRRRDNGHWEIPGGILELGESISDGVRREVREETGLDIEPDRLTGVYKNLPRGVVAMVFHAKVTGGTAGPSEETSAVTWWTPEEVAAGMAEVFAIRVHDALTATSTAVRAHDGVRILA